MFLDNRFSRRIVQVGLLVVIVTTGCIAQPTSRIQVIISAGNLNSLRWPDFRDYKSYLEKFYASDNYSPVWVKANSPSPQAMIMIGVFKDAWKKGLEPEDYDSTRWEGRLQALKTAAADPSDFDVALTVSTMRYVSDLRIGRINPKHFKFGLNVQEKKYDLVKFLRERLLGASDPAGVLETVEPPFDGYRRTEEALVHYVELARKDDAEQLPMPAKPIDPGHVYPGSPGLARKLRLLGDLPSDAAADTSSNVYGDTLSNAVKRFQRRHGLGDDGRLGPETVKQLNVPLKDRVRQLKLTLERWRWLPTEFPAPPIIVNVPDFRLRALDENNKVVMEMRVVVGKAMRTQTPVFSRDMTFVVLRPYWNVPPGIFRRSVLPAIERDHKEVARKRYEITTPDGEVVTDGDVTDEMVAQLSSGQLSIRQKPGPNNALGLIKLMFPNEYSVYLHSTPQPELFSRTKRDFSAGCIRVEKPAELGAWVLRNNPGWTVERVRSEMQNGKDNVTVTLARQVPVFIIYGTAIAYDNGEVHFYHDIYGHDATLAKALAKGYPYP